ncbi:MAG: adenylate/guanylate cyclase domain-containing protein [Acidimicrobiia bacterium]|nr:adenylate/guanylate cyclase domain-containing protein [Acidimicrobiia bacterium]
MSTGAFTFLFTDIEGSTRRWESHPDAMQDALERHDRITAEVVDGAGGHVFKHTGDGVCAVFESPSVAMAAAADLHRALAAETWDPLDDLRVRSAVHTGEADRRGDDFFGATLSRVARLMDAAHGGQIVVSEAAAAIGRSGLGSGQGLVDLGEHRFKDLGRAERVYQLSDRDLPQDFPALRSLEAFPNNLPAQLTAFIGRHDELSEVVGLIDESRLVTLAGVGGVGKTRLAIQAAAETIDRFHDGAWFVELAPVSDPGMIVREAAEALDVPEEAERPLREVLFEYLADRELLLVLDNCEHVIEEVASFAEDALRTAPGLRVLATSREGLMIGGERLWRVPSLRSGDDAVELFAERARHVRPGFDLDDENRATIAAICSRLDGIPLAIELATARLKVFAPAQIAERLDDRFRLLTGGSRTALPRQRTLQATMDWSYDLLSDDEKALLRRLAVFYGGFSFEAVEEVAGDDSVDRYEIVDLLTRLVDASLVTVDDGPDTRYRLLETVRQYAQDRLAQAEEGDAVRRRHAEWARSVAVQVEDALLGSEYEVWSRRLEADHDNFRAAMTWALESGNDELALAIASGLGRLWFFHSHLAEGSRWLERALEAAPDAPTRDRVEALAWLGSFYLHRGMERAHDVIRQAAEAAHSNGDRALIARTAVSTGNSHLIRGLLREAREQYEIAVTWAREVRDDYLSVPLVNLVVVHAWAGRFSEARSTLDELLDRAASTGNTEMEGWALTSQGVLAEQSGDVPGMEAAFTAAVPVLKEAGQRVVEAWAMYGLAEVARRRGDLERAGELWERGRAISKEIGANSDHLFMHRSRLRLARDSGDHDALAVALSEMAAWIRKDRGLHLIAWSGGELVPMVADRDPARALELVGMTRAMQERSGCALAVDVEAAFADAEAAALAALDDRTAAEARSAGADLDVDAAADLLEKVADTLR